MNKRSKTALLSQPEERVVAREFPFNIGDPKWVATQKIREKFNFVEWVVIDFELKFSDGSVLVDDKYSSMLVVIQNFLKLKWEISRDNLRQFWRRLSYFIEFLVNVRGVSRLSEAWGVDEYVAYRKAMGNLRAKKWRAPASENLHLTALGLYQYIGPVKELWHFSSQIEGGLKIEPWADKTAAKVAGVKSNDVNRILPYDLHVFAGFLRVARKDLETVGEVCDFVLSRGPFQPRIAAANRLRTAAAIALLATEGMRPDEIYALNVNCLKKDILRVNGESVDVTWIVGRIFKDEPPGGRPHRWLASDEAILAIEAMKKLNLAFEKAVNREVIPVKQADPALTRSQGYLFQKIRGRTGSTSFNSLNGLQAIKTYIQRPEIREFLGENAVVNHRRFRPTIARAFARLQLGDITYFKRHFGHAWWTTTRGYFLTFADDELQSEVSDSVISEAQNLLHDVLSSPYPLQGGRGRQIEKYRREYPVMIFERQKALLRNLQRGHQIRVGPQSLCLAKNGSPLCSQDCLYEEENCLGCPNGIVASMHLPVWEDMRDRNRALLKDLPLGSPGEIAISENLKDIELALRNMGGDL